MGVRQLETFMKHTVPNGTKTISIIDECSEFQRNNNGDRPTIVIDLMGLVRFLGPDNAELLCGGRHVSYRLMFELFMQKLSEVAELVFFEDGPVLNQKFATWVDRSNENYEESIAIMDKIYDQVPLNQIIEECRELPRVSTYIPMIEETAKKFGRLIVTVTRECDAELVKYANEHPSTLFILADDSDFLIFSGTWRYCSLKHLDAHTMTTLEYDRFALRNFLDLNEKGLKILSTLAGNDIMKYEDVRGFHSHVCGHRADEKFPLLANYIRNELPMDFNKMAFTISKDVIVGKHKEKKARIEDALKQYSTKFKIAPFTNLLLHYCRENYLDFTFSVLMDLPIHEFFLFYDLRRIDPDRFTILKELFSMQIGIVLRHKRKQPGGIHFEYCQKKSHEESFQRFYVSPMYPDDLLPPLIELLNRKDFSEHDELRFKLLKWTIDEEKLEPVDLEAIPKNYLIDILVLVFMTSKGFVTKVEADLILFTIKNVELGTIAEDLQPPEIVNERAFHISFLFTFLYSSIGRSLEINGLKDSYVKLLNFDGVYFHHQYLEHIASELDPAELLTDLEPFRIYK